MYLNAVEGFEAVLAKEVGILLHERRLPEEGQNLINLSSSEGSVCVLLSEVGYQCTAGVTPGLFCGLRRGLISVKPSQRKKTNNLQ